MTTHSALAARARGAVKTAIVRLAAVGLIPAAVATWLLDRGGLRHV